MYKFAFIIFCFLTLQKVGFSQDTLPNISVTQISNKALVSWSNPYTSVTYIGIQRSYDSLKNFTTIGSVLNVKATTNGFLDTKEFIPSQYYRLFISFEGGTYIFTASHRPGLDTLNVRPNLTEYFKPVQTWFIPSKEVYAGKNYNVIISLPDANKNKYSLKFFEDDGTFLFDIKKIDDTYLTLDKVNFRHAGLFKFELYKDGLLIERHKLYIPRDGKPIPALDEQGYQLK